MRIQNYEERIAETPAVLICDTCDRAVTCAFKDDLKKCVVEADKLCKSQPFKPKEWECIHWKEATV